MSATAPEAPALIESPAPVSLPFEFFDLHVVRSERVTPGMLRITFGGPRLDGFFSGGRDQRVKLFLPRPGQDAPLVPRTGDDWFTDWRAMDPAEQSVMRSYTVRGQRRGGQGPDGYGPQDDELDIDFALHGEGGPAGPATRWALDARPGDRVTVVGPAVANNGGIDFRPPRGTDWVLLSGDETALPAIAGILEWLPAGVPVRAWIEVGDAADVQDLRTDADAEITWLVREGAGRSRTELVVGAVREAELPATGTPYAWIAGEAGTVKALRRHLVQERGFDRKAVRFTGYWRLGTTEEQLVAEALAGSVTYG